MRLTPKPCINCGAVASERRCRSCSRSFEANRSPARAAYNDPAYKALPRFGKCVVCGRVGRMTVNHIVPLRSGGTNAMHNLELMCKNHNSDWRRY